MKWKSAILGFVLAGGVALVRPTPGEAQASRQDAEAHRIFIDGRDLFDDGKFAEAEKKFREALSKYPKAEQADRTTYYLITTLVQLRRLQDARAEIENFHRTFPASRWRQDVDEKGLAIGRETAIDLFEQEVKIAKERAESERRGSPTLPPNASWDAELLRRIIQMDVNAGIERVKERLKMDPSDPAVIANLGTIFSSNSPQTLPFLLDLWANSEASPNARTTAFFFAMRKNPDKEQVAKTLMEMLGKKENEPVVSEALFRMTYIEHRAVLDKIVESSNPAKFDAIEKIYRGGSITLRSDLLMAVAKLKEDCRAEAFILDAARNDKDLAVRRAALDALMSQKRVTDVRVLESLLGGPRTVSAATPSPCAPNPAPPK